MSQINKETEAYFENFFELFNTPGWKQFIAQVQNDIEGHKTSIWSRDDSEFPFYKGQVVTLDRINNFENLIRSWYDNLTSEEEEDDS